MRVRALVAVAALIGAGALAQVADAPSASAACALGVTSIAPATGFVAGGLATTITGLCFTEAGTLSVAFGGAAPIVIVPASATSLTVATPAASPGPVTVTVRLGAATATTTFTYVAIPAINPLVPARGLAKGGTLVTITGTNLKPAGSTTTVAFGGAAPITVVPASDTSLTVTSPAGTGTQNVTVTTTLVGGASATSNAQPFVYVPAPTVTSVAASSGPIKGGTDVVVGGTDFQPGAIVMFGSSDGSVNFTGDSPARPLSVLGPTSIRATTPAGVAGATNVVVINPDGQLGALAAGSANHFTYTGTPPSITTFSPASGTSLGGVPFTITGAGFLPGVSVEFAASGELNAPKVSFVSVSADGTTITGSTPPHATGLVDVKLTNIGGGTTTNTGAYTFTAAPAPTISAMSVSSGPSLGRTTTVLTGTNFVVGTTVLFDAVPAANAAVVTATSISVTTPAHAAGPADVIVRLPDGQKATLAGGFTFNASAPPTIGSVNPVSGTGGTQITIAGTGFANTNGASTNAASAAVVSVGSSVCPNPNSPAALLPDSPCLAPIAPAPPAATPPIVQSATLIQGLVPDAAGGSVPITVTNPDGQTATATFTYAGPAGAPTLANLSPVSASSLGGTTVTLHGTGFVHGARVDFGKNSAARTSTVVSADGGTVTVVTPAGIFGLVDVTVTNPGGLSATIPNVFTFPTAPQPTITDVTPSTGQTGTTVTITGTGFANTNGASTNSTGAANVTIGGLTLLPVSGNPVVRSDMTIVGSVPTPPLGVSMVDVAVMNSDGQGAIVADGFSYPADTSPPALTVTAKVGSTPYTFGNWATGHVTITVSATDVGGSGVKSVDYSATGAQPIAAITVAASTATVLLLNDGTTTFTAGASDLAGNVTSPVTNVVKMDTLAPSVVATATIPSPGGPVTYVPGVITNQNVTVSFACTDAGSGVATLVATSLSSTTSSGTNPLAVTVTSVGLNQSVSGTCTDVAGNTTTSTFSSINMTRTAPLITAAATAGGAPYTAGVWTNRAVTVTFACTPISVGNQIATLTNPVQVSGPTTNFTVTGVCTDSAGNSSTVTFGTATAGVDIDLTLPLASATATTTNNLGAVVPYSAGTWTNHDVVVTFGCSDSGTNQSGVATIDPPITVTSEGVTSGVVGGCRDIAGSSANPPAFFGSILIDKTAPVCTVAITPNPIGPANSKLVAVTAAITNTDAASGAAGFALVSIVSNSPATQGSDVVGFSVGAASTSGQLRATKGRAYTFTYQSSDRSGNASALCSKVVTVR